MSSRTVSERETGKSGLVAALAVMAGGAAGALCRFGGNRAIMDVWNGPFPLGILCINMAGGFLMGLLQGAIRRSGSPHVLLYNLLGTGFLGGFTTFSTFALDTFTLWVGGSPLLSSLNVILNACLCIASAGLGYGLLIRKERA